MEARVLVCGSRHMEGDVLFEWLAKTLDGIHAERGIQLVIHGAAQGADSLAERWAREREIPYLGHPAKWKTTVPVKSAGPKRNAAMLEKWRPHVVVAFPGHNGTKNMVDQARRAGVEVIEIPAGS